MLIKDGSKPDKMSDGHRTYSGNDFTTRHWHFGKKSETVLKGTCLKCVFNEGEHHNYSCPANIKSIETKEDGTTKITLHSLGI